MVQGIPCFHSPSFLTTGVDSIEVIGRIEVVEWVIRANCEGWSAQFCKMSISRQSGTTLHSILDVDARVRTPIPP